jgi:hypothetical protein
MATRQGGESASGSKPPKVEVLQPIAVTAIERRHNGDGEEVVARVHLTYALTYDGGAAHPSLLKAWGIEGESGTTVNEHGPIVLDAHHTLAFPDDYENARDETLRTYSSFLQRFIALGTTPSIASSLDRLGDDPAQNEPVVLGTGMFAELLRHRITPSELWVFLLSHGGARPKARAIHSPSNPNEITVRKTNPWLDAAKRRKRFEKAIGLCGDTALALRRVQQDGLWWHQYGISLPPLPPKATEGLISDLERYAEILKEFVVSLKGPAHHPADPDRTLFCRDWYVLAMERAANPLYAAGAALYSLIFAETTPDSFAVMCARARKGKSAAPAAQS